MLGFDDENWSCIETYLGHAQNISIRIFPKLSSLRTIRLLFPIMGPMVGARKYPETWDPVLGGELQ